MDRRQLSKILDHIRIFNKNYQKMEIIVTLKMNNTEKLYYHEYSVMVIKDIGHKTVELTTLCPNEAMTFVVNNYKKLTSS